MELIEVFNSLRVGRVSIQATVIKIILIKYAYNLNMGILEVFKN